ncbi:hypothetical protein GCM10010272_31470 [Streptomyces lateritius]|nr:hypothetical protein GCM10010272_31470 [Streptomyces lateritius]
MHHGPPHEVVAQRLCQVRELGEDPTDDRGTEKDDHGGSGEPEQSGRGGATKESVVQ